MYQGWQFNFELTVRMKRQGSPVKMKREGSPLKVKDYFANPMHRIRQPAFVEIQFSQSHLNTFIKSFTNRFNSRFVSFTAISEFITSFTNNSPKLIQMYEQFFTNNFTVTEHGDILLEEFVDFFNKEEGNNIDALTRKMKSKVFAQFGQLNAQNIMIKCEELGVPMTEKEAMRMVKMLNLDARTKQRQYIEETTFLKALQAVDQQE